MARTGNRVSVRVAALVVLAGAAASVLGQATLFTFEPRCHTGWYGECGNGQPCPTGGWWTFNNWGKVGCGGGLPTPGAGDAVVVGSSALNINGTISVSSLSVSPGTVVDWTTGDVRVAQGWATPGVVNVILGGNRVLYSGVTNTGTWTLRDGWSLVLSDAVFTNAGELSVVDRSVSPVSGSTGHGIVNSGTLRKAAGGGSSISSTPVTNSGVVAVDQGLLVLSESSLRGEPGATVTVSGGATLRLVNETLRGELTASNQGSLEVLGATAAPEGLALNVGPNPLLWVDGTASVGGMLVNSGRVSVVYAGNRVLSGSLWNTGEIRLLDGWSVVLSGSWIENDGVIEFVDRSISPVSGSTGHGVVNRGMIRKVGNNRDDVSLVPVVNEGEIRIEDGVLGFGGSTLESSGGSVVSTSAGATLVLSGMTLPGVLTLENGGDAWLEGTTTVPESSVWRTVGNSLRWPDGTITGPAGVRLTVDGPFAVVGGGNRVLGVELENTGTLRMYDGWSLVLSDATVRNRGLIEIVDRSVSPASGKTGRIVNEATGTLRQAGPTRDDLSDVTFTNHGRVEVSGGWLGVLNSVVDSRAGSSWWVGEGRGLVLQGVSLTGRLDIEMLGDGVILSAMSVGSDTTIRSLPNALRWPDGTVSVAPGARLTNAGNMRVTDGGNRVLTGELVNEGTLGMEDGWSLVLSDGVLVNRGTLELTDRDISPIGGGSRLVNAGGATLRKVASNRDTVSAPVTNDGAVVVEGGHLAFAIGTVTSGSGSSYAVSPGATLSLENLAASGRFAMSGGGDAWVVNVEAASDTVLNASGMWLRWPDGGLTARAGATLTNLGQMRVHAGGNRVLTGGMINAGTLRMEDGWTLVVNGGDLRNTGTMELIDRSVSAQDGSAIVNSGLMRKLGVNRDDLSLGVTNTGTIRVEEGWLFVPGSGFTQGASGVTEVSGTLGSTDGVLSFGGGQVTGGGRIEATVVNGGALVSPGPWGSPGVLTVTGGYTQEAGGVLEMEVRGPERGSGYDGLVVSGRATLGGLLRVRLADGYVPMVNQTFDVVTGSPVVGEFGSTDAPGFAVSYEPGVVRLTFVGVTCPGSGAGACGPGDWNEDGAVDFNDFLAFLNEFNAWTVCSDVTGDGSTDFNDFLEFLNRYNAGC